MLQMIQCTVIGQSVLKVTTKQQGSSYRTSSSASALQTATQHTPNQLEESE